MKKRLFYRDAIKTFLYEVLQFCLQSVIMSAILFKGGREHMELVKNTIVPGMQKFLFGEGEAELKPSDAGVLVADRKFKYSSLAVDILKLLGNHSGYKGRYVLRLKDNEAAPVALQLYFKVTM